MSCIYLKMSLLSCVVLKKWLSDVALNFWLLLIPLNCDFKSTTSASLRQHESIHIKEKTFSCTSCDYKSTTSASLKEHEAIHNPTTSFRGWTDNEAAIAALNASVTTASLNATLLNQGFREEEIDDQTYSQEDLEYENTLRALEQEDIPKMNDWLKVYLLESKLGKKYTALIYPAFST